MMRHAGTLAATLLVIPVLAPPVHGQIPVLPLPLPALATTPTAQCDLSDVPGVVWWGTERRMSLQRLAEYGAPIYWFSPDEPTLNDSVGKGIRVPAALPFEPQPDGPVVYYQYNEIGVRQGHLTEDAILIKKRIFEDFLKGSIHMLYHILMVGLSAALALSLPKVARFVAKQFLVYWSLVENDKVFLIAIETISVIFFIFLSTFLRRSWKDRKLSNMARAAGMVWATPAKGFFAKRRVRKLKENQGMARDVMVISSTGLRTFRPQGRTASSHPELSGSKNYASQPIQ